MAVLGLATPAAAGPGDGISLNEVTCQDGVPTVLTFVGNESEETQEFDVLLDRGTDVETRPVNWPVEVASHTGGLNASPLPGPFLSPGSTHQWAMYRQGALVDEVSFVAPECGDGSYRGYIDYVQCSGVEQLVNAGFVNSAGKTLNVVFAVNGVPLADLSGEYPDATNNSGSETLDPLLEAGTPYENTLSVEGVVVQTVRGVAPYCGDVSKLDVVITAPTCDAGNPTAQPVVLFTVTNNDTVTHYLDLSLNNRRPPQTKVLPGQTVTEDRFDETSVAGNSWSAVAVATFRNLVAESSGVWPECDTTTPPSPPADSDGDGVTDSSDNCPSVAGPASSGGCPVPVPPPSDSDQDGVADGQDQCPAVAGPVSNNGCPLPAAAAPAASVKVKAKKRKSKLYVDVNPNKGKRYWKFKVQKQRASGSWKSLKTYRTKGKKETRLINLKKGTYRVKVKPKHGYQGVTSRSVYLKR